jgi:hypothetical protein
MYLLVMVIPNYTKIVYSPPLFYATITRIALTNAKPHARRSTQVAEGDGLLNR